MLSFDFLDPNFAEKNQDQKFCDPEFQKQLAIFKFFMDILMKFDIDAQIRKTLAHQGDNKTQFLGQNIPPIEIHLCCSNIRHKTCFKAFQSLDLYLGYCIKKNCTITNSQLNGENGKSSISDQEMKRMLDPNQDPKNLHKSYFKLNITHDLITSKMRLMELYSTLAYRKSIQSKTQTMVQKAKFVFELQPCGRQPQFRYIDYSRKTILLKIFKTLDLIYECCDQTVKKQVQFFNKPKNENPNSPENAVQRLWDQMLEQQEQHKVLKQIQAQNIIKDQQEDYYQQNKRSFHQSPEKAPEAHKYNFSSASAAYQHLQQTLNMERGNLEPLAMIEQSFLKSLQTAELDINIQADQSQVPSAQSTPQKESPPKPLFEANKIQIVRDGSTTLQIQRNEVASKKLNIQKRVIKQGTKKSSQKQPSKIFKISKPKPVSEPTKNEPEIGTPVISPQQPIFMTQNDSNSILAEIQSMLPPITLPPAYNKRLPPPIVIGTAPSGTGPGRVSTPLGPPVIRKKENLLKASQDPQREEEQEAPIAENFPSMEMVNPKLESALYSQEDNELPQDDASDCSTQIGLHGSNSKQFDLNIDVQLSPQKDFFSKYDITEQFLQMQESLQKLSIDETLSQSIDLGPQTGSFQMLAFRPENLSNATFKIQGISYKLTQI